MTKKWVPQDDFYKKYPPGMDKAWRNNPQPLTPKQAFDLERAYLVQVKGFNWEDATYAARESVWGDRGGSDIRYPEADTWSKTHHPSFLKVDVDENHWEVLKKLKNNSNLYPADRDWDPYHYQQSNQFDQPVETPAVKKAVQQSEATPPSPEAKSRRAGELLLPIIAAGGFGTLLADALNVDGIRPVNREEEERYVAAQLAAQSMP